MEAHAMEASSAGDGRKKSSSLAQLDRTVPVEAVLSIAWWPHRLSRLVRRLHRVEALGDTDEVLRELERYQRAYEE